MLQCCTISRCRMTGRLPAQGPSAVPMSCPLRTDSVGREVGGRPSAPRPSVFSAAPVVPRQRRCSHPRLRRHKRSRTWWRARPFHSGDAQTQIITGVPLKARAHAPTLSTGGWPVSFLIMPAKTTSARPCVGTHLPPGRVTNVNGAALRIYDKAKLSRVLLLSALTSPPHRPRHDKLNNVFVIINNVALQLT